MTVPYTYYLIHEPTGKKYYGVRWAKGCFPEDLWVTYFSSSRYVKKLIKEYGKDSFRVEVRKTFEGKDQAILWEEKVLRRLKVHKRSGWLNVCISKSIRYDKHPRKGVTLPEEVRQKISQSNKGKPKWTDEDKNRMSRQRTGENHWNFGKTWDEETKKKNSESNKLWRQKNLDKVKFPPNPTGRKHSHETKQRMADARRKYWANKKLKDLI